MLRRNLFLGMLVIFLCSRSLSLHSEGPTTLLSSEIFDITTKTSNVQTVTAHSEGFPTQTSITVPTAMLGPSEVLLATPSMTHTTAVESLTTLSLLNVQPTPTAITSMPPLLSGSISSSRPVTNLTSTSPSLSVSGTEIMMTAGSNFSTSVVFYDSRMSRSTVTNLVTLTPTALSTILLSSSVGELFTDIDTPSILSSVARTVSSSVTTPGSNDIVTSTMVTIEPESSSKFTHATSSLLLTITSTPISTDATTETVSSRSTATPTQRDETIPLVIGLIVGVVSLLIVMALVITLIFHCYSKSRNFEYNTGNEYRVTVQKWSSLSAHYTANCESVTSGRGSNAPNQSSSNGKAKLDSEETSEYVYHNAHTEMYSTPL